MPLYTSKAKGVFFSERYIRPSASLIIRKQRLLLFHFVTPNAASTQIQLCKDVFYSLFIHFSVHRFFPNTHILQENLSWIQGENKNMRLLFSFLDASIIIKKSNNYVFSYNFLIFNNKTKVNKIHLWVYVFITIMWLHQKVSQGLYIKIDTECKTVIFCY